MTAHIYIKRWNYGGTFNWDNQWEIPFEDYSIDESDFRNKTAKITSPWLINNNQYSWAVKITNPHHETFTGIIIKRDEKPNKAYDYQCQDWNRLYMSKPKVEMKATTHKIIKWVLNWANYGDKYQSGLLAKNKYEQSKYGSVISFNPMKNIKNISVKDKTVKEIIENLVYSQKPFIDIHYNNVGVMQFTPYHLDKWLKEVASFHYNECVDFSYSYNTTDIVTQVSTTKTFYNFQKLFNTKNNPLANLIFEGVGLEEENKTNVNTTNKTNSKTSKTNNKTSNPYGTKKKEVWVNMDNCWGHSTDIKYINAVCKELRRLGWKVHNLGAGSTIHTDYNKASKCKNGIWLTLDNGVDCEVLRHFGHDNWFKGMLVRNGSRAVIGLINNAGNIKKGGKYYKYLGMAHDGTGKGNPGLRYPAGYCADCGLPFFYSKGNNPKDCARIFNAGGDSKIALQKNYNKKLKGYYANWNWSNKY